MEGTPKPEAGTGRLSGLRWLDTRPTQPKLGYAMTAHPPTEGGPHRSAPDVQLAASPSPAVATPPKDPAPPSAHLDAPTTPRPVSDGGTPKHGKRSQRGTTAAPAGGGDRAGPGPGNPTKPKHAGGRPRKIASPEEFDRRVDAYLKDREDTGVPITFTGLILALGLCSRDGFDGYAERPEFAESVKRARLLVEEDYERRLDRDKAPVGAIFALKNMGWSDRLDIEARGVLGTIDFSRLDDDQVRRIAAGESALSVLAGAAAARQVVEAQAVAALPAGEAEAETAPSDVVTVAGESGPASYNGDSVK